MEIKFGHLNKTIFANSLSSNGLRQQYLVRPSQVRIVLPEDQEGQHGHSVEDPDGEAEEVNQALDGAKQDHVAR